ncbi:hypothetical protein IJ670_02860, partial [bacterium]|nr:hypothetical protein [bacterium]
NIEIQEEEIQPLENNVQEIESEGIEPEEPKQETQTESLSDIANDTVEDQFRNILNESKEEETSQSEEFKADIIVPESELAIQNAQKLPIFSENLETPSRKNRGNQVFETGEIVVHGKYGKGKIIKMIQFDQRQLLQIEFENSGKKLLDPKVADINKL